MPDRQKIGLDNNAFRGRLRPARFSSTEAPAKAPSAPTYSTQVVGDVWQNMSQQQKQAEAQPQAQTPRADTNYFMGNGGFSASGGAAVMAAPVAQPVQEQYVEQDEYIEQYFDEPETYQEQEQQETYIEHEKPQQYEHAELEPIASDDPSYSEIFQEFIGDLKNIKLHRYLSLKTAIFAMACMIFLVGLSVSIQTWRSNNAAAAQIEAISQEIN